MSGVPISPDQVSAMQQKNIPGIVFDVTNELIIKSYKNNIAIITFASLRDLLAKKLGKNEMIDTDPFLSKTFRDQYESKGWIVNYYNPNYKSLTFWYIEFIKNGSEKNSNVPKSFNDDLKQTPDGRVAADFRW